MKPQEALAALHDKSPLVHCITNYVAMDITANVLLAAGASPAMVHAEEEVADFVPISGALSINIGTPSPSWARAMLIAARTAGTSNLPWVLDPVAHFATPYRSEIIKDLLQLNPNIIRGNASEILALNGTDSAGKGVDSGDSVPAAHSAAIELARAHECTIAVTGAIDFVTDGKRHAQISGGSVLMPKVTAMGCSLTSLMGGFAAVSPPFEATISALVLFSEAGLRAAKIATGPGSFKVAIIDALAAVRPHDLADEKHIQWL